MEMNCIKFAEQMTGELEKAIVQQAVTGFLADNVMKTKFVGAKTVLIPNVEFSGLGNYDREDGFTSGAITVDNTAYELEMDRGRTLYLDAQDNDEAGIADLAGQVTGEYVRTKVVPEIDAYTLAKLAKFAVSKSQSFVVSNKPYADFIKACQSAYEVAGYDCELVAFINGRYWSELNKSDEFVRQIVVSDFKRGGVNTQVQSINGVSLLPVVVSRMKTDFEFRDGTSVGQEQGGFVPTAAAKDIGFIIMPKKACSLIKKVEKTRIFSPDQNQRADAWKFDFRFYYDAFVKKSLEKAIFAGLYA